MPRFSLQNAIPVFLFLGIGCMCAYFGTVQAIDSQAKQSWPQVDAVVLESEAIFTSGQGEGGGDAEVKMLVEYRAQQAVHQALIYAQDLLKADHIPPRYAVGKTLTIYYDPTEPSKAIIHLPSVVLSLAVVLISLIPILPAMLFIVFWIAMGFTHWKMSQARRHLSQVVQEAEQFNQSLDQLKAEGLAVTPELLAKKSYLVKQVEEVHNLLVSLQKGIDDLTPPLEEEDEKSEHSAQVIIVPKHKLTTLFQRIVLTSLLTGIPLGLGFILTGWAPYYRITCERHEDNTVDCQLQQVLFGLLQYGESKTIADLREVDYEMKGEIRKQRAFLRFTRTRTKQICAGRAAFTTRTIQQFLDTEADYLQVSDGHTMLSLYFPYVFAMFSFAALIIVNKSGPLPGPSGPFAIGSLLAASIALLPFFYICDIHNTGLTTWLILAVAILAGGMTNVIWQTKT